jgi:hypothetical protein
MICGAVMQLAIYAGASIPHYYYHITSTPIIMKRPMGVVEHADRLMREAEVLFRNESRS